MNQPARYRLFKLTTKGRFLVVENADSPLSPYRATEPICHPWAGARIAVGSVLLLSDSTAAAMRASGGLECLAAEELRPWREVYEEKRLARSEARRAKLSRDLRIGNAGRPDQSGTEHGPQGTARA